MLSRKARLTLSTGSSRNGTPEDVAIAARRMRRRSRDCCGLPPMGLAWRSSQFTWRSGHQRSGELQQEARSSPQLPATGTQLKLRGRKESWRFLQVFLQLPCKRGAAGSSHITRRCGQEQSWKLLMKAGRDFPCTLPRLQRLPAGTQLKLGIGSDGSRSYELLQEFGGQESF